MLREALIDPVVFPSRRDPARRERRLADFKASRRFGANLGWYVPLVGAVFAKVWLSWGLDAALIVLPSAVALGFGIGAAIMARRRRM